MSHSAIVAAFLRKIERYNGILFMTTNRENDVDEAIASRCSAILKYELPSDDELFRIWTVLSKHYKIEMSAHTFQYRIGLEIWDNYNGYMY